MADSFFGFNTSLNEDLELLEEPDLQEEDYDALNDETFGADAFQGDWEEDHTKFAEVAENSKTYTNSFNSDKDDDFYLEASISQLVLEDEKEDEKLDAKKHKTTNLNNIPDGLFFDYVGGIASTWSNNYDKGSKLLNKLHLPQQQNSQSSNIPPAMPPNNFLPPQIPRIPTVQELERDIIQKNKQSKEYLEKENKLKDVSQTVAQEKKDYLGVLSNSAAPQSSNNQFQSLTAQQQIAHNKLNQPQGSKFPPGFGPSQQNPFNQPQPQQEMVMMRNNQNMPMQLGPLLLPPHMPVLLSPQILPPPPHPMVLGQNPLINPPQMIRFMPNHHPLLMQKQQQQQQQQQPQQQQHQVQQKQQFQIKQIQNKIQNNQDHMRNGQTWNHQGFDHLHHPWMHNPNRRGGNEDYDEYAGLMSNRERQWLLNIQIIQLATDKPHVDDYYYLAWSKKREKEKKKKEESKNGLTSEKQNREPFFANNRQPRSDSVQRERRDSEREMTATPSPRVYVPLQFENSLGKLQCGSVTAPKKVIDLDVVLERQLESTPPTIQREYRKTKKILLEIEQLYVLAMDLEDLDNNLGLERDSSSVEPASNKLRLLEQIMTSYLNEECFVSFMCIRKGKTLLMRVLPYLNHSDHFEHFTSLWCRLIKSISVITRRDHNDGILLSMYPYFKNWINSVDCAVLLIIASYLITAHIPNKKSFRVVAPNTERSVLSYIITTKFGASILSCILSRGEAIYPSLNEKGKLEWTNIVLNFTKHVTKSPNLENQIPTPLDPLPANVLSVILNRSTGLHIQEYASAKRILTAFKQDQLQS